MAIQAVVFDIGGIVEITPDLGWGPIWESRLGLAPGELGELSVGAAFSAGGRERVPMRVLRDVIRDPKDPR